MMLETISHERPAFFRWICARGGSGFGRQRWASSLGAAAVAAGIICGTNVLADAATLHAPLCRSSRWRMRLLFVPQTLDLVQHGGGRGGGGRGRGPTRPRGNLAVFRLLPNALPRCVRVVVAAGGQRLRLAHGHGFGAHRFVVLGWGRVSRGRGRSAGREPTALQPKFRDPTHPK